MSPPLIFDEGSLLPDSKGNGELSPEPELFDPYREAAKAFRTKQKTQVVKR